MLTVRRPDGTLWLLSENNFAGCVIFVFICVHNAPCCQSKKAAADNGLHVRYYQCGPFLLGGNAEDKNF